MKDNKLLYRIFELLEKNKFSKIEKILSTMHPGDIAYLLNHSKKDDQIKLFNMLDSEIAADVLPDIRENIEKNIINQLSNNSLIEIFEKMDSDDEVDILANLSDKKEEFILKNIESETKEEIQHLKKYHEETAGGLMQTEIVAVLGNLKKKEIIEHLRKNYHETEQIHYIFVINSNNKLIGGFNLTKLILAKDKATAKSLKEKVVFTKSDVDQEEVANYFRKYDIFVLPVVDKNNKLVGRITADDVIDVIDEEASEDAYKMVGLNNDDKVFTSPISSVKKRIPWLSLNLLTALLVSSIVGIFEPTIAKWSFLAVLMPIVAGLGGNSGTQTLTVIIRGIALGELTFQNTFKAIFKEIAVGLINGIIIGSIAMLIAYFLRDNLMLGIILGLSMVVNMFIAALAGTLIPVIMRALKIDPALSSSVIITMLTDMGGFASFLGLATILL